MKRVIGAAVTAVLLGSALAGCSSGGSSDSTGGGGGSKVLRVLTYAPNAAVYPAFWKSCAKDGYSFKELVVPQAQLINKATQLTSSGDAPAVIVADNNNIATLADAGVLTPISFAGSGLSPSDFVQGPLQAGQWKGKQYGMPVGNNGEVIVYNKKLLSEAKVSPPKSWADLTAAAKALTTSGRYGFAQTLGGGETLTWNWVTQLWSNGGSLKNLASKQSIEAAQFWGSFVRNKTAPTASLQWQATDIAAQLLKGKIAMGQVGTWVLPALLSDAKKAKIDIGITPQVSPTGAPPIVPFGGEELTAGLGATGHVGKIVNDCLMSFNKSKSLPAWDEALGYLPTYTPAQPTVLAKDPWLSVLADELKNSRSRTAEVGPKYAAISIAISTAIQKIAGGSASAATAMQQAQASISK